MKQILEQTKHLYDLGLVRNAKEYIQIGIDAGIKKIKNPPPGSFYAGMILR